MTDTPHNLVATISTLLETSAHLHKQLLSDDDKENEARATLRGIVDVIVKNLGATSAAAALLGPPLHAIESHINNGNMLGAAWATEDLTAALKSVKKAAQRSREVTADSLLEARSYTDALHAASGDSFDKDRFLDLLPQLAQHQAIIEALSNEFDDERVTAVQDGEPIDEDLADDLIGTALATFMSASRVVLKLAWDTGSPMGGSGSSSIHELQGVYLFQSTDYPHAGPFDSIGEALSECESFSVITPRPALTSDVVPLDQLVDIAENLVDLDGGSSIWINDSEYVTRSQQLRPKTGG